MMMTCHHACMFRVSIPSLISLYVHEAGCCITGVKMRRFLLASSINLFTKGYYATILLVESWVVQDVAGCAGRSCTNRHTQFENSCSKSSTRPVLRLCSYWGCLLSIACCSWIATLARRLTMPLIVKCFSRSCASLEKRVAICKPCLPLMSPLPRLQHILNYMMPKTLNRIKVS